MGNSRSNMSEEEGVSPQNLSLEQLASVKKQLEQVKAIPTTSRQRPTVTKLTSALDASQETQQFTMNLKTFKQVITKCDESKESLEAVDPSNAGPLLHYLWRCLRVVLTVLLQAKPCWSL